jgi:hypothetical protein
MGKETGLVKSGLIVLSVVFLVLILPTAAGAATRLVDGVAGADGANECLGAATPCRTIERAVAVAVDGVDEIHIAAGTYDESVMTDKRLTFVGAGRDATVVAPTASGAHAFALSRGGTLHSLQAVGAHRVDGVGGSGIWAEPLVDGQYALVLRDVDSDGGRSSTAAARAPGGLSVVSASAARRIDLSVIGGSFGGGSGGALPGEGVAVIGPGTADLSKTTVSGGTRPEAVGLVVSDGAAAEVSHSSLRGFAASSSGLIVTNATANVRNSSIEGKRHGVLVMGTAGTTAVGITGSVVLADTSLQAGDGLVAGGAVLANFGATASLTTTGTTLAADGPSADAAVLARSVGGTPTIVLRNSIARMLSSSEFTAADVVADGATASASSSSYTTVSAVNGGNATPVATAGNISGDPEFASPATHDFSLRRSPLIDRGDPAFVSPGELAYNDVPRSLDGAGDCSALPDIGAYEAPARPCRPQGVNQRPKLTDVSLSPVKFTSRKPIRPGRRRGTTIDFRLSERAEMSILIERKAAGRRVKVKGARRCVRVRPRNRHAPRCIRHAKVGTLKISGRPARNKKRFLGRVGRKLLKPGLYRMSLVAADAEGAKSQMVRRSFRVLEP